MIYACMIKHFFLLQAGNFNVSFVVLRETCGSWIALMAMTLAMAMAMTLAMAMTSFGAELLLPTACICTSVLALGIGVTAGRHCTCRCAPISQPVWADR